MTVPVVVFDKARDEVGLGGATDFTWKPDGIERVLIDAAGFVRLELISEEPFSVLEGVVQNIDREKSM